MITRHTEKRHEHFIEWKDVTVKNVDQPLLDSLTITVNNLEHIAILGPNGSGKSTFIRLITREVYPAITKKNSTFRLWGEEQWDVFHLRSNFGIVSSDLQESCHRNITGKEILLSGFFSSIGLFHQKITDEMDEKAAEVARFLDIEHLLMRPMTSVSTGEGRRLLIGRALVHNPKVLILDEPTNSLDLQALHTLRQYMRKIAHAGVQIILVTHQIHDIIPEIDRIILMKSGKIVEDGRKANMLTDERLQNLFAVPVHITKNNDYYYASGY